MVISKEIFFARQLSRVKDFCFFTEHHILPGIRVSTGKLTEQPDGELYEPESHGLVLGVHAPEYEQHAAHLGGGVDEHEQREERDVPETRVVAVLLARARVRLGRVPVHAQAVCKLQTSG